MVSKMSFLFYFLLGGESELSPHLEQAVITPLEERQTALLRVVCSKEQIDLYNNTGGIQGFSWCHFTDKYNVELGLERPAPAANANVIRG